MDPSSSYREGAIRGAGGVRLVIFLYEQAIQDLRRAVLAMELGDIELRTKQINHAFSVIGHLQGTVDREHGGEVGRNLQRFYCSVRRCLIEAHVLASKEILYGQISDLLSVREAWIKVDHATSQSSSMPKADVGRDTETPATKTATNTWRG